VGLLAFVGDRREQRRGAPALAGEVDGPRLPEPGFAAERRVLGRARDRGEGALRLTMPHRARDGLGSGERLGRRGLPELLALLGRERSEQLRRALLRVAPGARERRARCDPAPEPYGLEL